MFKFILLSFMLISANTALYAQDLGALLGGLTGGDKKQEDAQKEGEAQTPSALSTIGQAILGIGGQIAAQKISEKQNEDKVEELKAEYETLKSKNDELRSTCQVPSTLTGNKEIEKIYVKSATPAAAQSSGLMAMVSGMAQKALGKDDENLDYAAMISKYKAQNSTLETKCKKTTYSSSSSSSSRKTTSPFGSLFSSK